MLWERYENGLASDWMTFISSFTKICPILSKLTGQDIHGHEISKSLPFLKKFGQQATLTFHSRQNMKKFPGMKK
jgi:hypothetical protein